jgi:hypothetical protein
MKEKRPLRESREGILKIPALEPIDLCKLRAFARKFLAVLRRI